MRLRITHVLIAAAALALVAAPVAAQNLVVNGGFESPEVTNAKGWDIFDSGAEGVDWTVTWYPSPPTGAPDPAHLELHAGVNGWLPHGGSAQYAELDSDWGGPNSSQTGEAASICISQAIPTEYGLYNISYFYSPRPGHGDNAINVYWGDSVIASHSGAGASNTVWSPVELHEDAVAGTTTLKFCETGRPDSLGMFLDDVSVVLEEAYCEDQQVALCAGQTEDVGTVTVGNDGENLYVTFTIGEPGTIEEPRWFLEETHVAVATDPGDIPQTKKGNPIPGQFPYTCDELEPGATTCTATIPLDGWCAGQQLVVAAHAVVAEVMGDGCDQMTYWANEVLASDQGTLKNGGAVVDTTRTDPEAVFALDGVFYSLGFDLVDDDGYADGFLTELPRRAGGGVRCQ